VRKVLVLFTTAVGMALISCSQPPPVYSPTTSRSVYEPSARIARAPLPPPAGYASPGADSPTRLGSYGRPANEASEPKTATVEKWRASPRWAAVKGQGCVMVEQDTQANLTAQAEAANVKVGNCSKEDRDAGHEVGAIRPNAHKPGSSPNSHESELPSPSDGPSPSKPYTSPPKPPSENRSEGIEPWTGAI
jgi:hypothetical protein